MYKSVKEFTIACSDTKLPTEPEMMDRKQVEFIASMVFSEMVELLETVCEDVYDRDETAKKLLLADVHKTIKKPTSSKRKAADQADAMVDAIYYICNVASKHCLDLDACFEEVHAANMRKVNSETGKVIKRKSDGKILKPVGWTGPCIEKILFPASKDKKYISSSSIGYKDNNICPNLDANWYDNPDPDFDSFEYSDIYQENESRKNVKFILRNFGFIFVIFLFTLLVGALRNIFE